MWEIGGKFIFEAHFICLFGFKVVFLGKAALPAVAPITHEVIEEPSLQLEAWADANAKVVKVHLVRLLVGQEETEMARNGEEEVVVERWQLGQSVTEFLWCFLIGAFEVQVVLFQLCGQRGLNFIGHHLGWQVSKPFLQHAANLVRVVQLFLIQQVNVKLLVEATLPVLDCCYAAWNAI